jgi:hypothetical protein
VYRLFRDAKEPTPDEFEGIIGLPELTALSRTEFVKALIYRPTIRASLFADLLRCEQWIARLPPADVISIFAGGFYGQSTFLYALLYTDAGYAVFARGDRENATIVFHLEFIHPGGPARVCKCDRGRLRVMGD